MPSEKKRPAKKRVGKYTYGRHKGLTKEERDKKFWSDVLKIDRKHLKEGLSHSDRKILLDKIAFANTRDPKAIERIEIEEKLNRDRRKMLKASMHSSVKK